MSEQQTTEQRIKDVMLYTLGTLDGLKRKGLMTGGFSLSEDGYAEYLKLKASGFKATADEMREMMIFLQRQAGAESQP